MKTFNPHVSKFKVIDIMIISSYIIKMAVVLSAQWDYSKRTITLNSLYEPTVHHDWAHSWIKSFKQVYFVILHSFFVFLCFPECSGGHYPLWQCTQVMQTAPRCCSSHPNGKTLHRGGLSSNTAPSAQPQAQVIINKFGLSSLCTVE